MKHESAFPWAVDDGEKIVGNKGMTLRDYFAAKAMQSLITASVIEPGKVGPADNISDYAYSYADAMLKAREA